MRNLRSAEYHGEATLIQRLIARNGEVNESTFIRPFIESCSEYDLTPDHIKKEKLGYVRTDPISVEQSDEYANLKRIPEEFSFHQLTVEHAAWIQHNFPEQLIDPLRAEDGFDGLVEEVGELARARLKKRQGIRGTAEEHDEQIRDSVGDIVIFLNSWCIAHGIDLGECVETAWKEVRERDWKKYPKNGRPPKDGRHVLEPGDVVHTPMGPGKIVDPREAVAGTLCLVKLDS